MKKMNQIAVLLIGLFTWSGLCRAAEPAGDRQVWAEMCYKIARPVLENMSKGELQKNMQLEYSPTWDGRDKRVAYLETFGRLMERTTAAGNHQRYPFLVRTSHNIARRRVALFRV